MPDGDKVYYGVSREFAEAYGVLCDGYFGEEQIAVKIAKGLCIRLKRYGNPSIDLVNYVYADLSGAMASGIVIQAEEESYSIDQLARTLMGHRRGIPLAVDACKSYVMRIAEDNHREMDVVTLLRTYVLRVLEADFYERLPLLNHRNDVTQEFIEDKLERVRPYLELEIERVVSHIVKNGRVDGLRKKSRDRGKGKPNFEAMNILMPESS
ncbi:MAG TPA: hypothetical protein PLQ56_06660 [Aggregatilineales bacterium]|nr:hypothetical protein [Aggregatilineales bacterium]